MSAPTVRRRRLGASLRGLRESAGLKLEDVETKTGFTVSKVSRMELARVALKPGDVGRLLDLYKVEPGPKRDSFLQLAKEGGRRGWWQSYSEVLSPHYEDLISLESEASTVRTFEALLIPGLFQTSAYARSVITAVRPPTSAERVNALVEVRMARQSVLTRPEPPEVWAIIHEAALKPRISGSTLMHDQLQRLIDLAVLPHVNIQVMAESAPPHPGVAGTFTMLGFPERADLDVVLVENIFNSMYVEDLAEVEAYGSAFERLRAEALPFAESLEVITQQKDKAK